MDLNNDWSDFDKRKATERLQELLTRYQSGEELSCEETYFLCDYLPTDLLLRHPIGQDEFFSRFFIDYMNIEKDIKPEVRIERWEPKHEIYYNGMVREWSGQIVGTKGQDKLLNLLAEETKSELRVFRKKNSIVIRQHNSYQYNRERSLIFACSKYKYLLIKRLWDLKFKGKYYELFLDDTEIILDLKFLVHIVTRHFGEIMKPFESSKSHFYKDFYYKEVHLLLEGIFKKIDASGHFTGKFIDNINFMYNGQIYQVCTKPHTISEKGKPSYITNRIVTFYPVTDQQILKCIEEEYDEEVVDTNLSVYVSR